MPGGILQGRFLQTEPDLWDKIIAVNLRGPLNLHKAVLPHLITGGGGKVVKNLTVPFPNVEFQALLTEIAAAKPDAVYSFFAGGGAVKFVKDYAAAGLNKSIPLYGPGFLTDGTLEAQGDAAQGMLTTLHYADGLNTPRDTAFRTAYAKTFKLQPDVYAVQGYDAAQMLAIGLNATKGDISKKAEFAAAIVDWLAKNRQK